ncbi:DUF1651 domain-containing protein [Synechococcus sp. HJ21-Hayes]|uniref:DUF1651 domain-containing protein n=1 Tax=Synechococcus sp. HJ21-Hayes TaxID=2823736 RepID=UPI0020CE0D85|nr:DUF1651 domain-containing protein [Synechococcus sp. HJ21-Hayes]
MHQGQRIPSSPAEAWLSDQAAPLLKRRQRLSRDKAVELWRQRRAEGWTPCAPQWQPPQPPPMEYWR